MQKKVINPWTWQDKLGFVQGNEVTGEHKTLYTAGQVSVDEEGTLLHPGDMTKQIEVVLDNLETVLQASDLELYDVVKMTYYTTDIPAFIEAAHILGKRLATAECRPATSLIGVASLFHPDAVVEIEATAVI